MRIQARYSLLPAFVAGLMIVSACGDDEPGQVSPQTPGASPTPEVTVTIRPGATGQGPAAYGENPLVVPLGTRVTWVNEDSAPHTATSTTGVWDSETLATGQTFSFTFTNTGTFPYYCEIHGAASMSGTIQVNEPGATPSPTGTASPSPSPTASPGMTGMPSPMPSQYVNPPASR